MIDLHCHILPGVDDGAKSDAEAAAMAIIARDDGIRKIVATPHIAGNNPPPQQIVAEAKRLNEFLAGSGIEIEIIPGAEVNALLHHSLIKNYLFNQTNHVLIEFPHTHLPRDAAKVIFNLRINGFRPVIAHPERNPSVIANPQVILDLLDDGVYLQITAASITGRFGAAIQKCSHELLKKEAVHFIASDGHSATQRRPLLSEAVTAAARIIGRDQALKLVADNPAALLAGELIAS